MGPTDHEQVRDFVVLVIGGHGEAEADQVDARASDGAFRGHHHVGAAEVPVHDPRVVEEPDDLAQTVEEVLPLVNPPYSLACCALGPGSGVPRW